MILILAPRDDAHALCVAQDLEKMKAPFAWADSSRLSDAGRLEFRAGKRNSSAWTCVEGQPIELEAVETVWHRRRPIPALQGCANQDDMQYFRREWTETIGGVFGTLDAWFVNDPLRQEAALKPVQLRLAQRIGLRIPDTLITNDPRAAEEFVRQHNGRVVHKTISPPRHRFLATKVWDEADRAALPDLVLAPTIFQEIVTDCRELRVIVIGGEVYAAEFRPRAGLIDGRLDHDVPYAVHALPDEVRGKLLRLVRELGLVYSAIDMKLTDDGEYVFLELNPMGQYLYVEILTGLPLTAAMAGLLARGRAACSESQQRMATRAATATGPQEWRAAAGF